MTERHYCFLAGQGDMTGEENNIPLYDKNMRRSMYTQGQSYLSTQKHAEECLEVLFTA